jgi:hypothetical protein
MCECQAKPSQAKPSQANSSQAKSCRVVSCRVVRTLHLGLGALCLNALAHLRRRLVGRLVAVCCLVAVSYASVAGSPSLGSGA